MWWVHECEGVKRKKDAVSIKPFLKQSASKCTSFRNCLAHPARLYTKPERGQEQAEWAHSSPVWGWLLNVSIRRHNIDVGCTRQVKFTFSFVKSPDSSSRMVQSLFLLQGVKYCQRLLASQRRTRCPLVSLRWQQKKQNPEPFHVFIHPSCFRSAS